MSLEQLHELPLTRRETLAVPDSVAGCVSELAAISLPELLAQAELMTRVDRKYLLPAAVAHAALCAVRELAPASRVLEIAGSRQFAYDSVYFDSADRLSYRLTAQRRRRRFKLRTRSYLDTGGTFLEVKTKSGRGMTVKHRIPYEPENRAQLTPAGAEFVRAELPPVQAQLGGDAGSRALVASMLPVLVSRYSRMTLLLSDGSRATVDTELAWQNRTAQGYRRFIAQDAVILETKSAGSTSVLDRWLWRRGYRPSGISKFGVGMAVLEPHLPRNKWQRALTFLEARGQMFDPARVITV